MLIMLVLLCYLAAQQCDQIGRKTTIWASFQGPRQYFGYFLDQHSQPKYYHFSPFRPTNNGINSKIQHFYKDLKTLNAIGPNCQQSIYQASYINILIKKLHWYKFGLQFSPILRCFCHGSSLGYISVKFGLLFGHSALLPYQARW